MDEATKRKLTSYFGFALRERGLYVGMKLEEKLKDHKVPYLLLLPHGPEKIHRHLEELARENPKAVVIDYQGDFDVARACGYETLDALGLKDIHLGEAIKNILDSEPEEKETEEKGGNL